MTGVSPLSAPEMEAVVPGGLTGEEKIRLVERGSSLEERTSGDFRSVPGMGEALVESRFRRWCDAVAKGDEPAFLRYLGWRGLDAATARRALGPLAWTGEAFPAWIDELDRIVAALDTPAPDDIAAASPALAPFLAYGVASLQREIEARGLGAHAALTPQMMEPLQRWLRIFVTPTLDFELETLRKEQAPGAAAPATSDPLRAELVRDLLNGGWRRTLLRYPALARVLSQAISSWRRAMVSFLERWEADRASVVSVILGGREPGALSEVGLSLSDPHHGGQTVVALRFAGGERVLYKPRSGALEDTYFALIRWMNEQGAPVRFRVLQVLERGTHCWVEWLQHAHVQSDDELRHYARACGGLLAAAHLLRATDLHTENLIAAGRDPVVIDLETAVPPDMRLIGADANLPLLAQKDSVLRTALLPSELELGGSASEIGAFAPLVGARPLDANSSPVPVPANPQEAMSLPVPSAELASLVEDGFADTYRFLLARRDLLMADGGALSAFDGRPVRMIFRDTSVYQRIGVRSLQPRALRDGVDRSLELEVLKRPLRHPRERPDHFEIFEAEQRSLEALDIPYFHTRTDSHALTLEGGMVLPGVLHHAGYEAVSESFGRWSEADLAFQRELVRGAMLSRFARPLHEDLPSASAGPADPGAGAGNARARGGSSGDPASSAERAVDVASVFSTEAELVFRRLHTRAIRISGDQVTWMGPTRRAGQPGARIGEVPLGFSDGVAGIALFVAAYAHATGSDDARVLARAALRWMESAASLVRSGARAISAEAAGGTLYALARSATWLPEAGVAAAVRIATEWSGDAALSGAGVDPRIATAWVHGFLALADAKAAGVAMSTDATRTGGTAASAVATLAGGTAASVANAAVSDPLDAAARWGRTLAASRARAAGDSSTSAQAALALAKLFHATGEDAFRDGARVELRRAVLDTDLTRRSACRSSLVAVTALEAARLIGEAGDPTLASAALAAARETADVVDTLCCGTLGRAEALLVLAKLLGRPELEAEAASVARGALARAADGFPRFLDGPARPLWSPSLFHGDAGVGYTLLRLASRSSLPSVLLWR